MTTSHNRLSRIGRSVALTLGLTFLLATAAAGQASDDYERSTRGTRRLESPNSDLQIKVLVEAATLGSSELEIGEITIPGGSPGNDHLHESTEIFYVLSGTLDHVVNGETHVLEPGMVGIVRPGDRVGHRVRGEEPVKALVIWTPAGEVDRIGQFFKSVPLD